MTKTPPCGHFEADRESVRAIVASARMHNSFCEKPIEGGRTAYAYRPIGQDGLPVRSVVYGISAANGSRLKHGFIKDHEIL